MDICTIQKISCYVYSSSLCDSEPRRHCRLYVDDVFLMQPSAPCEFVRHTVLWVEETSKRKKLIAFLKDSKQFRFVYMFSG